MGAVLLDSSTSIKIATESKGLVDMLQSIYMHSIPNPTVTPAYTRAQDDRLHLYYPLYDVPTYGMKHGSRFKFSNLRTVHSEMNIRFMDEAHAVVTITPDDKDNRVLVEAAAGLLWKTHRDEKMRLMTRKTGTLRALERLVKKLDAVDRTTAMIDVDEYAELMEMEEEKAELEKKVEATKAELEAFVLPKLDTEFIMDQVTKLRLPSAVPVAVEKKVVTVKKRRRF